VAYFANNAAGALERALHMRTVLLRMISMAELRDPKETGNHVNRVAGYSSEIYESWALKRGLSKKEIEQNKDVLRMAAMLHDVGKVAISDQILKKPGKLTDEEFATMKQHTILGAKLFKNPTSDFDETARDVAISHHEKFNGTGYPGHVDPITCEPISGHTDCNGRPIPKKGEEISLYGRIVALADIFDALSSKRCYKDAWEEDIVLNYVKENSGKEFDPEIVDAFFACLPSIKALSKKYAD
jgi:putative nucleotidyltransferase with HDIG domain